MFGSDVLDVGVGMALLFLMMSLIATAVREAIEGWMKTRSSDLEQGLREMFDDREKGNFNGIVGQIYNHPLISSLYQDTLEKAKKSGLPSYIPSKTFVSALLDIVLTSDEPKAQKTAGDKTIATADVAAAAKTAEDAKAAEVAKVVKTPEDDKPSDMVKAAETAKTADPTKTADAVDPPRLTVAALRAYATALPDERLSKIMLTAIDGAKGDVDVVRKNLEGWFDSTMDRVSGWYKRRTQKYLFWIGILSAVFLNVDSITIAQRLTNDKTLREAIVATAKTQSTTPASGENKTYDQLATEVRSIGYPIGWKGLYPQPQMCQAAVAAPTKPAATPGDSAATKPADASATKADDPSAKKADGYGQMFYDTLFKAPGCTFDLWALPRTIAGWFVTAFAIMLGAPFWFDVLNKFMVVRSTIKPSEKSPNEASKDNPAQLAPVTLLVQAPATSSPDGGTGKK